MNSKFYKLFLPIAAATFCMLFLLQAHQAKAVLFNASGLLGHYDDHDNPVYTTSTADNIWTPNGRGFSYTAGTALDAINHRLFVSDYVNHRVMVFQLDTSNNPASAVATYVLGQPDFNSNTATTTQNGLNFPYGVEYDSENNRLFVVDYGNARVLVFNVNPSTITSGGNASYVLGQANFTTNTGTTTQSGFSAPEGGVYDAVGQRLFVPDAYNNRVLVFNVNPSTISNGENASFVLGQANFTSSVATTTQSGLYTASDATYDSINKRLFVSDYDNNRVLVFNVATSTIANGMNASYVLGQPSFTSRTATTTQSGLSHAEGLGYDAANSRLFVADSPNSRVMVFNVATSTLANGENASSVLGQTSFTASGATTTQSGFSDGLELGITYDSSNGHLFVSDSTNNRIMIFDVNSITNGEAAVGEMGEYNDDDTPNYTKNAADNVSTPNGRGFNGPYSGSVLDSINHRLFVVDSANSRVLVFPLDSSNNPSSAVASYVLGQPNFNSNGSALTQNGVSGNLGGGMAYDPTTSRLFVSDYVYNRVLFFDVTPGTIANGMNASYVLGQANFTSSVATTTQSGLNGPQGLIYDTTTKRLIVSDYNNSRVLLYDASPSAIHNGENAQNVIGQANFTSSTATTTQSGLNNPEELSYDAATSRLFVNDTSNNRVLVFNVAASTITNGGNAQNVIGQANFTSSTATTTQSGLDLVDFGMVFDDSTNRLFLTDSNNNRVIVFNVAPGTITNGENAEEVLGQTNFISSAHSTSQNTLNSPEGLEFDSSNRHLFVTDYGNNRILLFSLIRITTTSLPNGSVGSSYSQTISIEHSQSTVAFSVVSGTLPPGLSLNSSTGVISGIPTTVGTYAFTIQAADVSLTGKLVDQKDYTITIAAAQVAGGGGGGGILPPVTIPSPVLNPNPSSSLPGLMFPSSGQNSPQPISIITTTFPSNTLVLDNGTIYLIEHNTKIGFSSMKVFSGLGYKLKDVVKADSSSLPSSSYIFNNPSMEHAWGSWLIKNKTIYYSTEQGLIPIATWEIFLSNGGLSKYIVPMNVEDAKEAKLPIMEMGDGRVKP